MQSNPDILRHPYYPYADYAIKMVRTRFPRGAGNLTNSDFDKSIPELVNNIETFISFSAHSSPNAAEFSALITPLKSASADIMVCYAIGALRTRYNKERSLFNCIYINQSIVCKDISDHHTPYTHNLLIIGAKPDVTLETLFNDNSDALICDLWSHSIFTVQEFRNYQSREQLKSLIFLLYNISEQSSAGIILYKIKTLQGDLSVFPYDAMAEFFHILQEMFVMDSVRISSETSRKITRHHELGEDTDHKPHEVRADNETKTETPNTIQK